ncbi:MAG TPA: hypothetical protein VGH15_01160 [Caulobacteraceae bacterium]|jgi:hypothetical protein
MKVLAIAIAAVLLAPAAAVAAGAMPALMAGVYKNRFQNSLIDGEKYTSEDILEVVPYKDNWAFFRIHLEFYNGHECNISGIAEAADDRLVYRGPTDSVAGRCTLYLRRGADGIHVWEGENGACRGGTCGARGGYGFKSSGTADFTAASRRSIRYLPRLLASSEYADAVREFAARPR